MSGPQALQVFIRICIRELSMYLLAVLILGVLICQFIDIPWKIYAAVAAIIYVAHISGMVYLVDKLNSSLSEED